MKRCAYLLVVVAALVGCAKQTDHMPASASKAVKPAAFNIAGAPTVEFSAPDMMCPEGCGVKVKEILSGQPGAKEVVVDFDAKTATVAVEDASKFDKNAAVAALQDHGFKNSAVKGEAAAAEQAPPAAPDKVKDGAG